MRLEAREVRVHYRVGGRTLEAVRGVSLHVDRGERVGLIGESGSGKSSLARALLGLEALAGGAVQLDGQPMHGASRAQRRRFQPVFQDVGAALDPRMRLRDALAEPFEIHSVPFDEAKLAGLLALVQLSPELLGRLPRELSVGQRQRVNLARALALEPELLLLDEPVSALDVSVQAQVLNLLQDLVAQRALGLLVISHDLDVVAHLCTRVLVMYAGKIVEAGPVAAILSRPRHPYTRLLVESRQRLVEGKGEPPSRLEPFPAGCAFAPRCPLALEKCRTDGPALSGASHRSACFVSGGD